MIFQEKSAGSSVVTEEAIRDMFEAYRTMTAVTITKDGRTYSWEDGICWKATSGALPAPPHTSILVIVFRHIPSAWRRERVPDANM